MKRSGVNGGGTRGRGRRCGDCPSGRCGIISDEEKVVAVTERLQSFVTSRCFTVCVRERARPVRARTFSLRGNSQDSH